MKNKKYEFDVVRVKLVLDKKLYSEKCLRKPEDVADFIAQELKDYDREVFCVLNMNVKGQCINMNVVSVGGLNYAVVEPRETFKSAILSNAKAILLIHNHPSGSVEPSREDKEVTLRLKACGELLGIEVMDHIIVGGGSGAIFSFMKNGMMSDRKLVESTEKSEADKSVHEKNESIPEQRMR